MRVAALNRSAYEWIQHEPVGRAEGLTSDHLAVIREVSLEEPSDDHGISLLYLAALRFTDASTRLIRIPTEIFNGFRSALAEHSPVESIAIDRMMVEAVAVVSGYNMVSRFLVGLDVAGMGEEDIPS